MADSGSSQIDDVIYFVETPMQDGQAVGVVSPTNGGAVLQAVNDVTAAGAMYFSSAGNEGSVTKASASVWEGDFVDGGANALIPGGTVHNFGAGNLNDQITSAGARALLFWSDPLGGSNNDYDLFVQINLNAGASTPNGNASLQFPAGTTRCTISDRDIRNDTCLCGAAGPPMAPSK